MDANVQPRSSRSSSLVQSPTNDDDDSDTISVTSTVEPEDPPDTEYVVEGVHAERKQETNGELQTLFLVEWANFPLDQCTWEPLENLPEELTKQWEEKQATQDPSVALEFEEKYLAAFNAELEAARQRHRRRNAKRKRLGRPTTPFWFRGQEQSDSENEVESADEDPDSEAESSTPSSDGDNANSEAEEDNAIDHKAMEALQSTKSSSKAKTSKPPRPPNRVFTFDPDKALSTEKRTANVKSRGAVRPQSSTIPARPGSARELREPPVSTRYLGSARKFTNADFSSNSAANGGRLQPTAANPSASRSVKAVARKSTAASSSTPMPASVVSATTTPGEIAKKPLTGRKTSKMSINIFSGGSTTKPRQSIGDIENDSKSTPKLYLNHAYRRRAELRTRDRNDPPPDISKMANAVFAPGSIAQKTQSALQVQALINVGESEGGPSKGADMPQEQSSTIPTAGSATVGNKYAAAPKRSSLSSNVDRPGKRPKKVHFTEVESGPYAIQTRSERFPKADDKWPTPGSDSLSITADEGLFVSEPMDVDSNSGASPVSPVDTPSSSTAGARSLSLHTYKFKSIRSTQSVSKKLKFSTSSDRILDVTFDSIPGPALEDGAPQWVIDFLGKDCLDIGHMALAETLIAQLPSLVSQGFQPLCSGAISSATHSDDLDVVAEHLRIEASGLFVAQALSNLLVFPTKCADFDGLSNFGVETTSSGGAALRYFIFSSANPIFQHIRPSSSTIQGLKTRVGGEKVLLFPTILGIQYSALIASSEKNKKKSCHFFLAFPQRAMDWQRSIASWLSTRERSCKIYTNFESGSWLAFVEKAKRDHGVVIVHEALIPFLRRFPQLAKLLLKYPVNIWHFSESLDLGPPQPLVGSGIIPAMSTKLSRLFPHGSVVLVTPSFIVSEPQAAYKLFKWFFDVRVKLPNNKLVVAYDITEYLSDLSREKTALRSRLEDTLWKHPKKGAMDIAMDKNKAALTDQDLAARQKTWLYMDWWLSQQVQSEVPFSDLNPTIFADRSIDPHDEQSLVNWFGWWSMEHSHEYRKFYVVGSSDKIDSSPEHTLTSRTSRKLPLIKYSRSVFNDPDEAMRIALSEREQPSTDYFGFQSQCFRNDESRIRPWLEIQDTNYFAKLYRFPVSWADTKMALHYDDPNMHFKTIEQWWKSVLPWGSGTHTYNTFIGFFYTISEEWDPNKPPELRRHPWVAIWRPVDPHKKDDLYSHGKAELIIWDVRAAIQLEERQPIRLNDLTWMQQALINHVKLHAHEKNPNSSLERIWLGGFQCHHPSSESKTPVDITADYIKMLIRDLKMTLAGSSHHMIQNGYRLVMPMGKEHIDDDPNARIVFHPPRGRGQLQSKGASKCVNHLFEARLRSRPAKDIIYTYPPTMSWYQRQIDEGRHFEHILVANWEEVFSVMGVDKSTSAPMSASDNRVSQASMRKGSVSSNHSSASH